MRAARRREGWRAEGDAWSPREELVAAESDDPDYHSDPVQQQRRPERARNEVRRRAGDAEQRRAGEERGAREKLQRRRPEQPGVERMPGDVRGERDAAHRQQAP